MDENEKPGVISPVCPCCGEGPLPPSYECSSCKGNTWRVPCDKHEKDYNAGTGVFAKC